MRVTLRREAPCERGLAVLKDLLVPDGTGGVLQLKGLVAVDRRDALPLIEHYNCRRAITVTADGDDRQVTGFQANRLQENRPQESAL